MLAVKLHKQKRKAVIYRGVVSTAGRGVLKTNKPLKPGQERCRVCRNGAGITARGYLRGHRDLFSHPCHNKAREST